FGALMNGVVLLNHAGFMIEQRLLNATKDTVSVEKYCIMPNHIHAIFLISGNGTTQGSFPTAVSDIVQRFKTITTKLYINGVKNGDYPQFNKKIWQKSFHDHIIRNEHDYLEIWQYIDENPLKWKDDCFYSG
ncbi:MAG: transposase, partial [Oscillospiraceae bacterium]